MNPQPLAWMIEKIVMALSEIRTSGRRDKSPIWRIFSCNVYGSILEGLWLCHDSASMITHLKYISKVFCIRRRVCLLKSWS